jgi:hypothetical protein
MITDYKLFTECFAKLCKLSGKKDFDKDLCKIYFDALNKAGITHKKLEKGIERLLVVETFNYYKIPDIPTIINYCNQGESELIENEVENKDAKNLCESFCNNYFQKFISNKEREEMKDSGEISTIMGRFKYKNLFVAYFNELYQFIISECLKHKDISKFKEMLNVVWKQMNSGKERLLGRYPEDKAGISINFWKIIRKSEEIK